ncbi:ParA family protein [Vibrio marisflavi]|uniref:AAA domain-containing protein n=1 Tax=Vibrio marisflavi CECT 7928 TaxID=634439 RepID=A0ABM9A9X8_9VIBR|nr:ParA family protein [Vibrio marisflavi]CAH0543116.1 hypothetical protein VMF7928_04408 [Vibrio marisflavi CECT 7928]
MKIIDVWNPKGGQGKSMIAINLAAATLELGKKALVICQDPQGTSTLYQKSGNLPFEITDAIPKSKPDVDVIIFDHQAADWEVPEGKLIVMPLKPARDQYATYIDAHKRAQAKSKQVVTILTDVDYRRKGERKLAKLMEKEGAFILPSSGVYGRAAEHYRSIFDDALNRSNLIRDRRREMLQIMTHVLIEVK